MKLHVPSHMHIVVPQCLSIHCSKSMGWLFIVPRLWYRHKAVLQFVRMSVCPFVVYSIR